MLRGAMLALSLVVPAVAFAAVADAAEPWWRATMMDADGDRIDDALLPDLARAEPLVVLVAYAGIPTAAQRAAVAMAGFEVADAYEHFDVLAVRALPADVPRLLELPGVVF